MSPSLSSNPSTSSGTRAVVLGASMAGLLAARVLADHFDEVLLLDRDVLPEGAAPRKGTPHALHPHGLLARGLQVLEQLFPGFTNSMRSRGGVVGDLTAEAAFEANHQRFAPCRAGLDALGASRLAIEAELRQRVLSRRGVQALCGVNVLEPVHEDGRVTAARYQRSAEEPPVTLRADLVVDCTGRGSHAPRWLAEWGYDAPVEERVDIGIAYTSAYFKRAGACAMGPGLDRVASFGAVTNAQPRPGVVLAQEPDAEGTPRWVAGVGGFRGDHGEPTLEALRTRARSVGSAELVKVTHEGELMGEVMRYHMPHSFRRRFERMRRVPRGLLVLGDALASFNPIYGQGMTVAACEALALQQLLQQRGAQVDPRDFFRAAARVVETPWQLAVGGDLSIDSVPGHRPAIVRAVNAYIARLYTVAPHDAVVSLAFQRVVHMLDGPQAIFAPGVLWRVLRGPRVKRQTAPLAAGAGDPLHH